MLRSISTSHCILFVRGTGPMAIPAAPRFVNMQQPAGADHSGILSLPCIGDGRQSGTSGSPSILNCHAGKPPPTAVLRS